MSEHQHIICGGALALIFVLGGCAREESTEPAVITDSREVVEPARRHTETGLSSAERFGFDPAKFRASVAQGAAVAPYTWEVPAGWVEIEGDSFSLVKLQVQAHPEATCTLSVTGGGIEPNLNRWCGQLGRAPLAPAEVAALPRLPMLGGEALHTELEGTFQGKEAWKIAGAVFDLGGGSALFVKMNGPITVVDGERENFAALCASVKAGAASADSPHGSPHDGHTHAPSPTAGTAGAEFDPALLKIDTPEHWVRGPERMMRLATFSPKEKPGTECIITPLAGPAGGVLENLNRWREQMGVATALTQSELAALPQVDLLGSSSPVLDATGTYGDMGGNVHEGYRMLGAIGTAADSTIFVKMVGPAADVAGELEHFMDFCRSLRYGEGK